MRGRSFFSEGPIAVRGDDQGVSTHSVAQSKVADVRDVSSTHEAQLLALFSQVLSLSALSRQRLRHAEPSSLSKHDWLRERTGWQAARPRGAGRSDRTRD